MKELNLYYSSFAELWATYISTDLDFDITYSKEGWSKDLLAELEELVKHALLTGLKTSMPLATMLSVVSSYKRGAFSCR